MHHFARQPPPQLQRSWNMLTMALTLSVATASAQSPAAPIDIPLVAAEWAATDSIRFETHLGRPAMYINRGVALARGVELREGVFEFAMAATAQSNFLGVVFHALREDHGEVLFVRAAQSGTSEAVQYGPAFNSLGAAWQLYQGPHATATADIPRERWIDVRLVLSGGGATVYLDGAATPLMVIPRLAGGSGSRLGVWTGLFGQGGHFSRMRYTPAAPALRPAADERLSSRHGLAWELSQVFDAEQVVPGVLPDSSVLTWQRISAEPDGLVLINRFRTAPTVFAPRDPTSRAVLYDSMMTGRVKGTKVVYARTFITAEREELRRMQFGYSDGVVIHINGQPLFFGLNAQFFRGDGIIARAGDAVYLPLRRGRNEIVLAVTEYSGGWGFWANLDDPVPARGAGPARR